MSWLRLNNLTQLMEIIDFENDTEIINEMIFRKLEMILFVKIY